MLELDEETKNDIFAIVEEAVEDYNFLDYETQIIGWPNPFVYGGYNLLIKVKIDGKDHNGHHLYMDLMLKMSDKSISKDTLIRRAYKKEIFVYKHIFREFHTFLRKKCVHKILLDISPAMYKIISTDTRDVLIFNSLKEQGYIPNFSQPFISPHFKYKVLSALAKFHAASFVFKDQRPEEFKSLMDQWESESSNREYFFRCSKIGRKITNGVRMAMDILDEENRSDLGELLQKDVENGPLDAIDKVLSSVPEEYVVIHGDCRTRNFLTKHDPKNPEEILKIKFINWQFATIHSPVLDLGYFLYFTQSEESNEYFEQYVEFYYQELSNIVAIWGSDIHQMFPFTKLLDHLLKYSKYSLMMVLSGIPMIILDNFIRNYSCVTENCECEFSEPNPNCKRSVNYENLEYKEIKKEIREMIKEKIIGVLELHYKYFVE